MACSSFAPVALPTRLEVENVKCKPPCITNSRQFRPLLEEVHDRRLSVSRVRRRISVDLPRLPGGLPPVRLHPLFDSFVCLVHTAVRPAVDGDGSFATWRFGRVHFARSFKCARDLDAEVAQYRRAWLCRVVVEEDIVAVSPQPRLTANEVPDLTQCKSPRRANRARRNLAAHSSQLAGGNVVYVDGDWHS